MNSNLWLFRSIITLFFLLLIPLTHAAIPTVISYQGKVTDSGGDPVADGNYTMRFRIYDASTGGSLEWDSGNRTIAVSDGVFNVLLGESPQPSLDLEFNEDYWLLVTFAGVNQSPRQRMSSAGYAYMASGLIPGTEVKGSVTSGTTAAVKGTNTAVTGTNYGVFGQSYSTNGSGVYGLASATSGYVNGVYGATASTSGSGVYGFTFASTGPVSGVNGRSGSTSGRGVFGYATSQTGATYGVYGQTLSTAGTGVYGWCAASSGSTRGVYGKIASSQGTGVYGEATSTAGITFGGYFKNSSSSGTGVYGETTSSSGTTYGVYGWSSSSTGKGVYGRVGNSTGDNYGVHGETNSTQGRGVFGEAPIFGVYGEATSTAGAPMEPKGVYGSSVSLTGVGVYGTAPSKGVYGRTFTTSGEGVFGWADNSSSSSTGIGVQGWTEARDGSGVVGWAWYDYSENIGVEGGAQGDEGIGVRGRAMSPSGTTYGVYGQTYSTSGYGVYYVGGLGGTGMMTSVVRTSKGPTGLGVHTTAGDWVEDFGEGKLAKGRVHIDLDPIFLETVKIDDDHSLLVFIQPQDPTCNGLSVIPGKTGFDVVELLNGTSDASFAFRVIAKRRGFEERRLEVIEAAREDPYLYPEFREKELREHTAERAERYEERTRLE